MKSSIVKKRVIEDRLACSLDPDFLRGWAKLTGSDHLVEFMILFTSVYKYFRLVFTCHFGWSLILNLSNC